MLAGIPPQLSPLTRRCVNCEQHPKIFGHDREINGDGGSSTVLRHLIPEARFLTVQTARFMAAVIKKNQFRFTTSVNSATVIFILRIIGLRIVHDATRASHSLENIGGRWEN